MDRSPCIWYVAPLHIFIGDSFFEIGIYHPNLALTSLFRALIEWKGEFSSNYSRGGAMYSITPSLALKMKEICRVLQVLTHMDLKLSSRTVHILPVL
jgi:hypothetical protein